MLEPVTYVIHGQDRGQPTPYIKRSVRQGLSRMTKDGLLSRDSEHGHWTFDADRHDAVHENLIQIDPHYGWYLTVRPLVVRPAA